MSKKVLILSGSPRKNGNSDTLCEQFLKGALEAGHEAEKIFISSKNIGYCKACYYCQKSGGTCAIRMKFWKKLCKLMLSYYQVRYIFIQ